MYELRIKGRLGKSKPEVLACWSGHWPCCLFLLEHSHTGGLLWANCAENPAENTFMTQQKEQKTRRGKRIAFEGILCRRDWQSFIGTTTFDSSSGRFPHIFSHSAPLGCCQSKQAFLGDEGKTVWRSSVLKIPAQSKKNPGPSNNDDDVKRIIDSRDV